LIALNFILNSDTVNAGMVSLEIWRHHNYLLESYYFPSPDPFWFSDTLTFHLIPQIVSDFNPIAIRIMCYIIFILIVLIYSILINKIYINKTQALIFAAFMTNLPEPVQISFYLTPTCHNATIFFVGLCLFLFSDIDYKLNIELLIYIFLIDLIVFSDSIFIAWFIMPLIFWYIIFYKNKTFGTNASLAIMTFSALFTYLYKSFFIRDFIPIPVHIRDLGTILFVNLPIYVDGLATLIFGRIYEIKPLNYICLLILIIMCIAIINNSYKNNKLFFFFAASAFVIFIGYISTDLCVNIYTARYLTMTALSIYLLISILYRKDKKIYTILIFIVLSIFALSNYTVVSKLDYQPNKEELGLIDYLNNNQLKYGYADYWDSNILTYLSNERVIVLPITINNQRLEPFRWISCEKWFTRQNFVPSTDYFILFRSNLLLKKEDINLFTKNISPKRILQFGSYTVYVFTGPAPIIGSLPYKR
jgi:hypothetical protein